MSDLGQWLPADSLRHISTDEQEWLTRAFMRCGGYPSLEQIWNLMNEVWVSLGCDAADDGGSFSEFYSHTVWLLNGLFIEQHAQSLDNRSRFVEWIVGQAPVRVAEIGGGFGTLARMIGKRLPGIQVDIIEPHPHALALAKAAETPNVRYLSALNDSYDIMVATDVFEHVPDPLQLAADSAAHLKIGGIYLIANCFAPVIDCHLPRTFHFRCSWDHAMKAVGLDPRERVAYGRVFIRRGHLDIEAARRVERRSRALWPLSRRLPGPLARALGWLLFPSRSAGQTPE